MHTELKKITLKLAQTAVLVGGLAAILEIGISGSEYKSRQEIATYKGSLDKQGVEAVDSLMNPKLNSNLNINKLLHIISRCKTSIESANNVLSEVWEYQEKYPNDKEYIYNEPRSGVPPVSGISLMGKMIKALELLDDAEKSLNSIPTTFVPKQLVKDITDAKTDLEIYINEYKK